MYLVRSKPAKSVNSTKKQILKTLFIYLDIRFSTLIHTYIVSMRCSSILLQWTVTIFDLGIMNSEAKKNIFIEA